MTNKKLPVTIEEAVNFILSAEGAVEAVHEHDVLDDFVTIGADFLRSVRNDCKIWEGYSGGTLEHNQLYFELYNEGFSFPDDQTYFLAALAYYRIKSPSLSYRDIKSTIQLQCNQHWQTQEYYKWLQVNQAVEEVIKKYEEMPNPWELDE